jgi:hypothetical protein
MTSQSMRCNESDRAVGRGALLHGVTSRDELKKTTALDSALLRFVRTENRYL